MIMMAWLPWSANTLFQWDNIIIISWLSLIFAPFHRYSKYLQLYPTIFLCLIYTAILYQILFHPSPNSAPLDFFHLSGWVASMKDPYMIVGTTTHFCVADVWLGKWIVHDFYTKYTCGYSINGINKANNNQWTGARIILTINLLISYMLAPLGFIVYQLLTSTIWKKYKATNKIRFGDPQGVGENSYLFQSNTNKNDVHTSPLNYSFRPIRFGDTLSQPFKSIYFFCRGVAGVFVTVTIAIPSLLILAIFSKFKYSTMSHSNTSNNTNTSENPSKEKLPNPLVPEYFRVVTSKMRLELTETPYANRNFRWKLKFYLLQLATFVEYIINNSNPVYLFNALKQSYNFGENHDFFPFGDGIGVASYKFVKKYLQDIPPLKSTESLGWQVSSSQAKFCDFTSIFLNSNDKYLIYSRKIIMYWLHSFPHQLPYDKLTRPSQLQLDKMVERRSDKLCDDATIYQSVGETMFFLATGGELTKDERNAFIDCVKNPFIFFPNWFNFLVLGNVLERKNYNSYHVLLGAFSRYADSTQMKSIFEYSRTISGELDIHPPPQDSEILRLIAVVFAIAGSAAPSKLCVTVIQRLWDMKDKNKNNNLYQQNPENFIKECARLDKVVPMVNVLASQEIVEDIRRETHDKLKIPINTPIHCSVVNANRDPQRFPDPDTFNPNRPNLDKIIVWNGVEEDINQEDPKRRPPRYCPGHDFSIHVIKYVTDRYAPYINNTNGNSDSESPSASFSQSDHGLHNGNNHLSIGSASLHSSITTTNNNDGLLIRDQLTVLENNIIDNSYNFGYESLFKDYWKDLDNYSKMVYLLLRKAVNDSNVVPARGIDMSKSLNLANNELLMIRVELGVFLPSFDEDNPRGDDILRLLSRWAVNQRFLDFTDLKFTFNNYESAMIWRQKYFADIPLPNVVFKQNGQSSSEFDENNELLTQIAFAGIGAHYTRALDDQLRGKLDNEEMPPDAFYINDMSALFVFKVRDNYERYGAICYFNKQFEPVGIYWNEGNILVAPNHPKWNHAKLVWRSSLFLLVTISDHLIITHMYESNSFTSSTRSNLSQTHPLRTFLKPFTYHTVSVNYQASQSLINNRGLVHRIWAFDYDEFIRVCDFVSLSYQFTLLKDIIHPSMRKYTDKKDKDLYTEKIEQDWDYIYPMDRDSHDFWKIVRRYVSTFFTIHYKTNKNHTDGVHHDDDDNEHLPDDLHNFTRELVKLLGVPGCHSTCELIDILTHLVCVSTCFHEHVGQVSDYVYDPRIISTKLKYGHTLPTVQSYTQLLMLTVVTGLKMPGILEDWSHLIDQNDPNYPEHLQNYRDFKKDLFQLSAEIDERNKTRRFPFQSFNPRVIECSTSV